MSNQAIDQSIVYRQHNYNNYLFDSLIKIVIDAYHINLLNYLMKIHP